MSVKQKVALEGVRFFAYHGFYPEEQLIGNHFVVDIVTEMEVTDDGGEDLERTVNYEKLFEIATAEMKMTRKLLETVAHAILHRVVSEFSFITAASISIRKMKLPMAGEIGNSLIQLSYTK